MSVPTPQDRYWSGLVLTRLSPDPKSYTVIGTRFSNTNAWWAQL